MNVSRLGSSGRRTGRGPAWLARAGALLALSLGVAGSVAGCAGDEEDAAGPAGGDTGAHDNDAGADEADVSAHGEADVATEETDVGAAGTDSGSGLARCAADPEGLVRPEGWSVASHCKGEPAAYDLLFDDSVVQRFDITVSPADYQATLEDLDTKLSGGGGGGLNFEDPIWVPVTVTFQGRTWSHVGMRYKGNSSLKSTWTSGVRKLAFRLSFDKFEDEHPQFEDQRFWGFKKMTFSNAFKDLSLIRDKLAADIFRAAGVPAARGAFARVYVDYGEGPVYFGLYTMIEDPSDELLDAQFGDDSGNLYKPDGEPARFTYFDAAGFEKKTNEDEEDFSDVIAAIEALQADRTDAAAWRAGLEAHFEVDSFLRCLAVNQAMVNWDSYGFMTHNFYVYGSPAHDGRLVWFPWDLNEAMSVPRRLPGGGGDPGSVMLDGTGEDWPLIRYLLDDEVYRERYRGFLAETLQGAFAVERVQDMMRSYHALIEPYVVGPEAEEVRPYTHLRSGDDFAQALEGQADSLIPHVADRHVAVEEALAGP